MAIQIRKRNQIADDAPQTNIKEAEVVTDGSPDVDVKLPEMNDKFLMTSGNAMTWLVEHRRMVLFYTVLVIAICVTIIVVFRVQENARVERSSILSPVYATLDAPTATVAKAIEAQRKRELEAAGIAAETDDILHIKYFVPDDVQRYNAVEKHLSEKLPTLTETEIGPAAFLLMGGIEMHQNKNEDAQKAYQQAMSGNNDIKLFALLGIAETLVQDKKYEEALNKYNEISALSSGFASFAKLSQAKIYEAMGNTDKAVDAYISVIRDFDREDDHLVATSRLRVLSSDWESRIVAPAGAAPAGAAPAGDAPAGAAPAGDAPAGAAPIAPASAAP